MTPWLLLFQLLLLATFSASNPNFLVYTPDTLLESLQVRGEILIDQIGRLQNEPNTAENREILEDLLARLNVLQFQIASVRSFANAQNAEPSSTTTKVALAASDESSKIMLTPSTPKEATSLYESQLFTGSLVEKPLVDFQTSLDFNPIILPSSQVENLPHIVEQKYVPGQQKGVLNKNELLTELQKQRENLDAIIAKLQRNGDSLK